MLVLCASPTALSAGQKCNATRLTWESQQSTVVAGETRLDAALLSFSEKANEHGGKSESHEGATVSTRSLDRTPFPSYG